MDWVPAISSTVLLAVVLWLSRGLIATRLSAAVKHEYDSRIERLRASFRRSEETIRADLVSKQIEIVELRSGVLSNITTRQVALQNRRIEAVDSLWGAVVALAPAKNVSKFMSVIKFEGMAEQAAKNEQLQQMYQVFGKGFNAKEINLQDAHRSRPFVSPMAWAYFSAFQAIVLYAVAQLQMLEAGVNMPKILDVDVLKRLVNSALPHQADYIEEHGSSGCYFLLAEIESLLLSETYKNS